MWNRHSLAGIGGRGPRPAALLGALLLLSACANFAKDGGMDAVSETVRQELGKEARALRNPADEAEARARIEALLKKPLSADDAVQLALLSNRGLQAAYNQLFAAEAAKVAASLPPSPTFSIARFVSRPEIEIERQVVISLLALATLPERTAIAERRFRQAQLRATIETLRIAAETRRAYYRAVAAQSVERLLAQAKSAAETATRLARRLGETGALNKLDQAREQVFYAEIAGELAKARLKARSEREHLTRLLGLWGPDLAFRLPPALPAIPRRPAAQPDIEKDAIRQRADLQIARLELEALARSFGLTRATRFVNILEVAGRVDTITERADGHRFTRSGFEIEISIPIFDWGEARVRQAEQAYLEAANRLLEKAINIRSEARDAYRSYRASYDIARHYAFEVVPLRRLIASELLLRYNAMIVDVFELLAEARSRVNANIAAIEAQRDFWLADVELTAARIGGGAGEARGDKPVSMPANGGAKH